MKKINKLIKIFLVLCLTVSQFTPLISVSAEEIVSSAMNIIEKNNKSYFVYNSNNNFEVGSYNIVLKGTYTYLDGTKEIIEESLLNVGAEAINGSEIEIDKYNFDGIYNLNLKISKNDGTYELNEVYSENIEYQSGLKITTSSNINDNSLAIDSDDKNVSVEITVLPGKLAPTYKYSIPMGESITIDYTGIELNGMNLKDINSNINILGNVDYKDYLYSTYIYNYNIDFDVEDSFSNNLGKLTLSNNLDLKYGKMLDNDKYLNSRKTINATFEDSIITLKSYTDTTTEEEKLTIEEVISDISNNVYPGRNYIYKVFNSDGIEIIDYNQLIDNDMVIEISYMGVILSYTVNFENDYNKDTYFNKYDLLPAIENFINGDEKVENDIEKTTSIVGQINGNWNNPTSEIEPIVSFNGNEVVNVDDELILTYDISNIDNNMINAFGGIINYDSEKLELISITANDNWVGKFNLTNNKILFASTVGSTNGTLLTIKFKALVDGETEVSLSNVSLAINNSSSSLAKYNLSKEIKILTNYGVGGGDIVPTLTNNTPEDTTLSQSEKEVTEELTATTEAKKEKEKATKSDKDETNSQTTVSRVVIVILIVLVIAGLVYLIFKDDEEENDEVKKTTNKTKKK